MAHTQIRPLRLHSNADIVTGTKLTYPDHSSQSGLCSICILCGACETGKKAKEGRSLIPEPFGTAVFSAEKRVPNLEDIQILPEIIGNGIDFTSVNTKCEIGGFKCSIPVIVGALGSTKIAHSQADPLSAESAKAGIPRVIGENVFATHGKKAVKTMIDIYKKEAKKSGGIVVQVNANEHGLGLPKLAKQLGADAIEIKLGQGAKQNLGGQILFEDKKEASSYKKANYTIIPRKNAFERHSLPGDITEEHLRSLLNEYAKLGLQIWLKVGIGAGITRLINLLDEIKLEQDMPIACLTIDGHGSGTGMAPWHIMNEVGLPSASLFSVLTRKPSFQILLAGGYSSGTDIAKAMMLGADGVVMGRPFLIASKIKGGITNFSKALKEEMQYLCAVQKINDISELYKRRKNLFALSRSSADVFGISYELKRIY